MKKFLITGADFRNKGGQSMLYITISELRDRFPHCRIYFPTNVKSDDNYNITDVFYNFDSILYMHGGKYRIKAIVKSIIKGVLRKFGNVCQIKKLNELFPELDAVIDISGFNLSSDWNDRINFKFLEYIRQAKKYNIPMYLMPQSFGPFDYKSKQDQMDKDIKQLLSYCKIVFVREKAGIEALSRYKLNNVILSPDLVLQNKNIKLENIFQNIPEINVPLIKQDSVAIVPNLRTIEHGDEKAILNLYKDIVEMLCAESKFVYVVRHASEDIILYAEKSRIYLMIMIK